MTLVPYPGESLAIYDALDVGGADDLVEDIYFRDGSRTIASGGEWLVWFAPWQEGGNRYLDDAGEDVTISWVVEVLSGSGTLVASEGADPSSPDPGVSTPTSLGTVAVTGAGTYEIPSTLVTVEEFMGTGDWALRLECTSGSIEIQQVKVQAMPPGGPVGGWVDKPGFETDPTDSFSYKRVQNYEATEHYSTDAATAWAAAKADFDAQVTAAAVPAAHTVFTTFQGSGFATQGIEVTTLDPLTYGAGWLAAASAYIWVGDDWQGNFPIQGDLVEGVEWIRPPPEVAGDNAYMAQQLGTGSTEWLNAQVNITEGAGADDVPGGPSVYSVGGDYRPTGGVATFGFGTGPDVGAPATVALDTSGRDILAVIFHSIASGDGSAYPGLVNYTELLAYTWGVDGDIQTYAIMPAYQVWMNTAGVEHPLRLMQRGDGLGMGSGRILGAGTRQGSLKVFGSL